MWLVYAIGAATHGMAWYAYVGKPNLDDGVGVRTVVICATFVGLAWPVVALLFFIAIVWEALEAIQEAGRD